MSNDFLTQDEVDALLGIVAGEGADPAGSARGGHHAEAKQAISAGDASALKDALEPTLAGPRIDPPSAFAWSQLARAAVESDQVDCLAAIAGMWPFDDLDAQRPLWMERAARRGSMRCLERLIDEGAAQGCPPGSGISCPALLAAASAGQLGALAALIPDCDPGAVDPSGEDAFSLACQAESLACCLALLETMGDPLALDRRGWSALDKASRHGFMPALAACLEMAPGAGPLELARAAGIAMGMGRTEACEELYGRARAMQERSALRLDLAGQQAGASDDGRL